MTTELILPFPTPQWIYEGVVAEDFEDGTGAVFNRTPRQIHANLLALVDFINLMKGSIQVVTENLSSSEASKLLWVDTSAGAKSIVLPSTPAPGQWIFIGDYKGTAKTGNITLTSPQKINGIVAPFVLNQNQQTVLLEYVDEVVGWKQKTGYSNLSDHVADIDPHPQYTTEVEASNIAINNSIVFALALG